VPPGTVPLGIRGDGTEAAAGLAALGGLGLDGPGAEPAARAVLAALLAQAPPPRAGGLPAVIIPAPDAARLLPGTSPAAIPGLAVPATLEDALGELETLQLTLARISAPDAAGGSLPGEDPAPAAAGPAVTLIASAGQDTARRLAGILDAGRRAGIAAVLLGAWPAGVTCHVAADGITAAVTPPHPDLDGTRLFTLSAAEAAAIASVMQEAAGRPAADSHDPAVPPASREPEPAGRPAPGDRPVQLAVLGPLRITAAGQETAGGMRKARELLAFLAIHPQGASGEAIAAALWPDAAPERAAAQRNLALRKARELLRTATGLTAPMWIISSSGRYRLDPALISTDYQAFSDALDQARTAGGDARLAACRRAAALYRGELAEGEGYEWAEPYAETARRRALDAWTAIAEILAPADPAQALSALETALAHDPYNEYLYLRIIRLQAAAGRPDAVRRTLAQLESRLAELSLTPSPQVRQAAAALLAAPGPGTGRP
jgi:DNA-binding SARP family transcriptional activator